MEKRKLASVQYIHHITPIEGADKIECVHVLGWQCVANKGQFQAGDRCVYIEVDSFLPVCEKFEFLRSSSFKKSEILGIRKWEMEERVTSSGTVVRGYADSDIWNMCGYLQVLLPDMLEYLKNHRYGSPGYLGENYTNEDGILVNDTCHEVWDEILDRMIFLWRETDEETCSKKNPYEEEYRKAFDEFTDKYGIFGEKLQTPEELEANRKRGGGGTVHFMHELPEYKEISEKHMEEEKRLEQYRIDCKNEVMDLMKEHFFALWD